MGSDRFGDQPALACRPFDHDHDGFIFGECCGAVVIESVESCDRRGVQPYATLRGWGIVMDGNRNPDPSLEGETQAIQKALSTAGLSASQIDYVNPHGTGSFVGDETELKALRSCGLTRPYLNATNRSWFERRRYCGSDYNLTADAGGPVASHTQSGKSYRFQNELGNK
jgi:malonyl-ACP decarboxylase